MFDKLIVSEPESADIRPRRSYFVASSIVVGVLFVTAVVVSIYSADLSLGNDGFDLTEMLAPVDMATVDPEPPTPQTQQAQSHSPSKIATRTELVAPVDQSTKAPSATSVVPNTVPSMPKGPVAISNVNTDPGTPAGSGRDTSGAATTDTGLVPTTQAPDNTPIPDPPAAKAPPVHPTVSKGVINGNAIYLPKPVYLAAAQAVGAQGMVDVQVLIDESGHVVSARAVTGNLLLRNAAEQAARSARFTPTKLSDVPVKVTGVIVYNFVRT